MKTIYLLVLLGWGAMDVACAAEFSFSNPVRLTLAHDSAASVAIGDANGDGRADLASTSVLKNGDEQLSLFLQNTNGTLAAPVNLWLSNNYGPPPSVGFVDLDGDGVDEIVVGSQAPGLKVVRLDRLGALSLIDYAARRGCEFLTTGDIDSDGNVDVVCHDWKSTITLYYGDGAGGFASTAEIRSSAGAYSQDFKSVRLADVTGDGRPDLLVTASSVNSFFVHTNNGFGGFWPATVYTHPWTPTGVWAAALEVLDLDGDGINEVVTASPDNRPDAALNIYRRGAGGYLYLAGRTPLHDSTTALIADDVDGDGDADLIAGHYGFNAVSLREGGAGGMTEQTRYDLPGFGHLFYAREVGHSNAISLGDLDGDGCTDLAGATHSGVFLLYGCEPFANQIPVSDFDGDGVADLLWRREASGENEWWQWADWYASPLCARLCAALTGNNWEAQAVGDFDGDGNSDVFWRDRASGANSIAHRSVFQVGITGVANQRWQVVGAGDFDGDDRSDLLWRNLSTGANTIWKSANSTSTQVTDAVTDLRWEVVGVGDFDGDGRADILWRHSASGRNVIWRAGRRTGQQELRRVGNLAWQVAGVGDFDGDWVDDVVWRNTSSGANTVWLSADAEKQQVVKGVSNLAWRIAAVADYNGDNRSDVLWRHGTSGQNIIWRSADSKQQQAVLARDPAWRVVR